MRAFPIRRDTTRRSYTLIELLLVITLLGLAGALLVPHMVGTDNMQLQAAVRKIIGDLSFAQSDALANQEFRRVHFFDDGSGYCLVRVDGSSFDDAWEDWEEDEIDYVHDPLASSGRYIVDFTADPRFRSVVIEEVLIDSGPAGPVGEMVYDPLGGTIRPSGAPGTGGTIVVSAAENSFTITVSPFTGKLTVQE